MIIPELPDFLSRLGGASYKGLIISLFTVTAMISRPFSGKLADKVGRKPVIIFGAVVCIFCSALYPLLTSIFGFFLLRLVHGFSTGFTPTGQTAFLGDIIPPHRRGEATGILGTAGTVGMAGGPALGGWLATSYSLEVMFYVSSAFALLSVLIVASIRETVEQRQRFVINHLRIHREDLFEPRVWIPCVVMVLTAYAYGALYTVMPDLGAHLGIHNKGVLFSYFTLASLMIRLLAGKASDRYGRAPVLIASSLVITAGMLLLSLATSQWIMITGVVLYGLGQGSTSPTLLAWATDLSDERYKGRGVASLYIFMEFGIGMGAVVSGFLYDNRPDRFLITFALCSALSFLAFLFLIRQRQQPTA
ncbi:MAG: MFS transporter [Cyclobacteriaceae bacterium]|nr:MFS transporter [Cyclobacteriaceae bacterium]